MPATRRIGEAESLSRTVLVLLAMALSSLPVGTRKLSGQDTIPVPDSSVVEDASGGLPIFLTLGMGYGQRSDPCTNCPSPDDTDSFTGHLSLGRYLGYGLGIGIDASVWKRGHPGPPAAADSAGVQAPTTLSNMLGNASLTLSFQLWRFFVRGGGGLAWVRQDLAGTDADGEPIIVTASGLGIGYSVGGGITLPLGGMASIAFFGNWNVGQYDLMSPTAVLERDAKHEYLELGMGITLR